MPESIEAVYRNGMLRPLDTQNLKEDHRYRLVVEEIGAPNAADVQDERTRVREVLRAAGLLAELGPNLKAMADPTISLEEVRAALSRAGGTPLSELILEDRGPKD
jgi:predicted DNA-binding antitoxin AbrB/MazE fold protein